MELAAILAVLTDRAQPKQKTKARLSVPQDFCCRQTRMTNRSVTGLAEMNKWRVHPC